MQSPCCHYALLVLPLCTHLVCYDTGHLAQNWSMVVRLSTTAPRVLRWEETDSSFLFLFSAVQPLAAPSVLTKNVMFKLFWGGSMCPSVVQT